MSRIATPIHMLLLLRWGYSHSILMTREVILHTALFWCATNELVVYMPRGGLSRSYIISFCEEDLWSLCSRGRTVTLIFYEIDTYPFMFRDEGLCATPITPWNLSFVLKILSLIVISLALLTFFRDLTFYIRLIARKSQSRCLDKPILITSLGV